LYHLPDEFHDLGHAHFELAAVSSRQAEELIINRRERINSDLLGTGQVKGVEVLEAEANQFCCAVLEGLGPLVNEPTECRWTQAQASSRPPRFPNGFVPATGRQKVS